MRTYTTTDIEANGARIAARIVAEAIASGEIVNVLVDDCDAADALLACIEDASAYVDATWLDISTAPVRDVSGESDAGDFRILIHLRDAKTNP